MKLNDYLFRNLHVLEATRDADLEAATEAAIERIVGALSAHKPLLICGNGGSAADAMHIAGELVGRYKRERAAYRATALGIDAAVATAIGNDYAFDDVFARQVEALGEAGGVVWGISTSGQSENVVRALAKGRQLDMACVALTGEGGGRVGAAADTVISIPSTDTPHVQEMHTCVYHHICEQVEQRLSA
jgi:D-sedoheptulose 7-phosphate isomerase